MQEQIRKRDIGRFRLRATEPVEDVRPARFDVPPDRAESVARGCTHRGLAVDEHRAHSALRPEAPRDSQQKSAVTGAQLNEETEGYWRPSQRARHNAGMPHERVDFLQIA